MCLSHTTGSGGDEIGKLVAERLGYLYLDEDIVAWAAAEEEDVFWRDHYDGYVEQYPDRFVAVAGGQVVAASSDLRHLLGIIEGKGLDVRRTWVRYIAATPRDLIL